MLLFYLWKGIGARINGDPAGEPPRSSPLRVRSYFRGAEGAAAAEGIATEMRTAAGDMAAIRVVQGMDNDVLGLLIGALVGLVCVIAFVLKLVLLAWTTSAGTAHLRGWAARSGDARRPGGWLGRELWIRLRNGGGDGGRERQGGGAGGGRGGAEPATSVASLPPPLDDVCPICLTHFYDESLWHAVHVQTWPCSHWFCGACFLTAWSRGNRGLAFPARCPVCRQEVRLLLASRPGERPLPLPEVESIPDPDPGRVREEEGQAEGRRRRFSLRIMGLRRRKASVSDAKRDANGAACQGHTQAHDSDAQRGLAQLLPAGGGSRPGGSDIGRVRVLAESNSARQLGEQTTEQASAEAEALSQVDKYNRLFGSAAGTILTNPLRWLTLLRWLVHELWSGNTDMVLRLVRNLRLIMFTIVVTGYILSPVDFFPESILGFVGLFDDLLFAIVVAIYISNAYREYIVVRSRRNAGIREVLEPTYSGDHLGTLVI